MLIDEDDVASLPLALHFTELGREKGKSLVPRGGLEGVAFAYHRRAIPVGIVHPLHRRQTRGADGATIHRMLGVPLEFDGPSVSHFSEHTAGGGAFTASGRVVGRHTRDGVVG